MDQKRSSDYGHLLQRIFTLFVFFSFLMGSTAARGEEHRRNSLIFQSNIPLVFPPNNERKRAVVRVQAQGLCRLQSGQRAFSYCQLSHISLPGEHYVLKPSLPTNTFIFLPVEDKRPAYFEIHRLPLVNGHPDRSIMMLPGTLEAHATCFMDAGDGVSAEMDPRYIPDCVLDVFHLQAPQAPIVGSPGLNPTGKAGSAAVPSGTWWNETDFSYILFIY